jgi:hypothetical protein
MGLFEQYPWLLVPIIILTVEAWQALKSVVRAWVRHQRGRSRLLE